MHPLPSHRLPIFSWAMALLPGVLALLDLATARLAIGNTGASTFAGDAQHTAVYTPAAQDLNAMHWTTPIDLNTSGAFAHYGAPLLTAANTILVPVKTATNPSYSSASMPLAVRPGRRRPPPWDARGL